LPTPVKTLRQNWMIGIWHLFLLANGDVDGVAGLCGCSGKETRC